ncbi:hypothetical protein DDE83_003761 [Stemphylium lycopersici]|uniref:Uncharacterized protein n=1 Tax=Stemphylium lycopersici TaxID=183478 RepID=A0A364N6H1_STELY|nr:hypothetical protein DDE83_003761 [Stemphylium lycopersici]
MTAIATGVVMTFEYLRWQALRPKFQGSKNIKAVKKKQSAGIDSNKTVTANQGPISEQTPAMSMHMVCISTGHIHAAINTPKMISHSKPRVAKGIEQDSLRLLGAGVYLDRLDSMIVDAEAKYAGLRFSGIGVRG